ncbi:MAG: hypothetical protein K9W44_08245 [Candidatus Lokiarchaeota archaeon]|nr:hypothetical protein [Candidatus Harpocratesius repetitus]
MSKKSPDDDIKEKMLDSKEEQDKLSDESDGNEDIESLKEESREEKEVNQSLENTSKEENEQNQEESSSEKWEEDLQQKMSTPAMKRHLKISKRKEFRAKIQQKKQELNAKTSEIVEGQFMKVFDKRVLPYTILFIIFATLIGIAAAIDFPSPVDNFLGKKNIQNFKQFLIITLAIGLIIANALLFWMSRNLKIHKLLFVEGGWIIKLVLSLITFFVGFGFCIFWWNVIDAAIENQLDFLTFQALFGIILALIYFGWNAGQIFFVKTTIESQAIRSEAKFQVKNENVEKSKVLRKIAVRNYLIVFIPLLIHIIFTLLYIFMDTAEFYQIFTDTPPSFIGKFTPEVFYYGEWKDQATNITGLSDFVLFLTRYFPEVWFANNSLLFVLVWSVLVLVLLIFLLTKQISLYKLSKKNDTPNVFSGMFFLIFSIFLYLKLFSILNTGIGMSAISGENPPDQLVGQIIDWITSILLMLITIFNLLRGFGKKIRTTLKSSKITEYNLAFLMFLLVGSYWGGQWSLITGQGLTKEGLNIATSLVVVIVYIGFYYWYSGWVLERRGFVRKHSFTLVEVKEMLTELSKQIKDQMLQTIENEQIITNTLNNYLLSKKIILGEGTKEESLVEDLEEKEEEKNSEEKLAHMKLLFEKSQLEQQEYEAAIQQLKNLKNKLKSLENEQKELEQAINKIPKNLNEKLTQKQELLEQENQKLKQQQLNYNTILKEFKSRKPPKEPKIPKTADGTEDEDVKEILMKEYNTKLRAYEELQKKVEKEDKVLAEVQKKYEKQQAELTEIQNKVDETNNMKARLVSIESDIESVNKEILAVEKNLDYLKMRAELAQPVIKAAKIALKSAEKEFEDYKLLANTSKIEKQAEEKLTKAQQYHEMAQDKLTETQNAVDSSRKISVIDADIENAEDNINKLTDEVKKAQKNLSSKEKLKEEKLNEFELAKNALDEAQSNLEEIDEQIKKAKKELAKSSELLEKGEELKAEFKNASEDYNIAKQDLEQVNALDILEKDLDNLQAQEKELKSDLKLEKKRDPIDQNAIDEIILKLDEVGDKIKDKKREIKETKKLQDELEQKLKRMQKLEEQQIDIKQIKETIQAQEEDLQKLEQKRIEPQKILDDAQTTFNDAEDALEDAKKQLKLAKTELKAKEDELSEWEETKKELVSEREERVQAEKDLKEAKKNINEAIKLLNEAKNYYSQVQEKREKHELQYYLSAKEASIDYDIYKKEHDLKEAHYTLKQAMRQAEANVELRKEMVQETKQQKEDFLKQVKENPDKVARKLKNEKLNS